jgi:hypothetical protein
VVAYYIQWGINSSTSGTGFGITAGPSSETLGRGGPGVLKPGTAVVVMPSFVVLTNSLSASTLPNMERQEGNLLALRKARSVTISMDSAVLASGQFSGPDTMGLFPHLVSSFSAWRDVDLEVNQIWQPAKPSTLSLQTYRTSRRHTNSRAECAAVMATWRISMCKFARSTRSS